jgi:hypothetical protein
MSYKDKPIPNDNFGFINYGLTDDKLFSTSIYFQIDSAVFLNIFLLWNFK